MSIDTRTLTPARRWLVQRMHDTHHGTMHGLVVRNGDPVTDPPPKIRQAFKLGARRAPRRTVGQEFLLKDQHVELFDLMEAKRDGLIARLVIQDGLPFLAEWDVD